MNQRATEKHAAEERFYGWVSVLGEWVRCDKGCRPDGSDPFGCTCKGGQVRRRRRVWLPVETRTVKDLKPSDIPLGMLADARRLGY